MNSNKDYKKSKFAESKRYIKKEWQLYSLLIIPIIYLIIFRYIPIFGNVIAFRRFVPGGSIFGESFVGFFFFEMFLNSPVFWNVFKNTAFLGALALIFVFPLPIIFALLLNEVKNKKFKKSIQTASYLPHFFSMVVVAGMIMELLSSTGPVNQLIRSLNGNSIIFMQDPNWFRVIYVASEMWQTVGWGAILYLAALSNIDESLYEAAKIDGANRWKQTLYITLPGIAPTIVVLLILNVGSFMNVGFEKVLLLQNSLNMATADVISTYVFRTGIESANFSFAAAIGLFESLIGLTLVLTANFVARKVSDTSLW